MAPGQACWAVVVALLFLAYKSGSSAGPLPHRKGHALHRQEALALVAVLVRPNRLVCCCFVLQVAYQT